MNQPFAIVSDDEAFTIVNRQTTKSVVCLPQANGMGLRVVTKNAEKKYTWHEYSHILKDMVEEVYDFQSDRPLPTGKGREHCPEVKRRAWAVNKTIKCVSGTAVEAWRKLLTIERFQKMITFDRKLFRVRGVREWNQVDSLYKPTHDVWTNQHLYNDAVTYQPCMMLLEADKYYHGKWSLNTELRSEWRTSIVQYDDWKAVFAFDKTPYKALNKTLLSINYHIALHELRNISQVKIPRPLETRRELYTWLAGIQIGRLREDIKTIVLNAKPKEISKTAAYLRKQGQDINLGKSGSYYSMISYLRDYDGDNYHGDLLGLAKRSVAYHELIRQNRVKAKLKYDVTTKTALPPFDFSKIQGARHLATVQDVVEEGGLMGHCVAGYATSAVKGHCYLFHVEHQKEKATVEVVSNLTMFRVAQAQGPNNRSNKATQYAQQKFTNLFKELAKC